MNKRYFGYVRVSTEEQAHSRNGLDDQKAQIVAALQAKGDRLVMIAEDPGFSGSRADNRPALQEILQRLRRREADGLVVAKLDRLSRSVIDFGTMAEVARRQKWSIICLDAEIDTSTAVGRAMVNILAVFAQMERELIGERTKAALRMVRAKGVKLGAPRLVDEAIVERIGRLRAEPLSWQAIARTLNQEGVKSPKGGKWHPATCQKALERHWVETLDRGREPVD